MICRICENPENNKKYLVREMMLGFRDEFTYIECSRCGCLQIAEIPANMAKYYPSDYLPWARQGLSDNFIGRFIKVRLHRYALFKTGLVAGLLPKTYMSDLLLTIAKAKPNYESRILDVGCGAGELLYVLRDAGMRNLVGVDPYISSDVTNEDLRILKQTIHDLPDSEKFDLVIFNHSFEHIPDQFETLSKVSTILEEDGVCVIRMPVKTEHIWNLYGVDWVQIDAPRHFFVHTVESFHCLAKQAGLTVRAAVFDSNAFQFWGSEQYRKNMPLEAENSHKVHPETSIFTPEEIAYFGKMAQELNKKHQGDQAAFYLVNTAK